MVIPNETHTSEDSRLTANKLEKICDIYLSGSDFLHSAVNKNATIKFTGKCLELEIITP